LKIYEKKKKTEKGKGKRDGDVGPWKVPMDHSRPKEKAYGLPFTCIIKNGNYNS